MVDEVWKRDNKFQLYLRFYGAVIDAVGWTAL